MRQIKYINLAGLNCINAWLFQDLEKSKYATEALDLSKMQEQTRQQEQMTKIKEYEVHLEQMKVEQKRVEGEQKREYLKEEAKVAKHKAEYQVRTLMLCFI